MKTILHRQQQVVVIEGTASVLSKVLVSGGGRCNVMHNPMKPVEEIAKVTVIAIAATSAPRLIQLLVMTTQLLFGTNKNFLLVL